MSVPSLERSLHQYTLNPSEVPFDMKSVPVVTAPTADESVLHRPAADGMLMTNLPGNIESGNVRSL